MYFRIYCLHLKYCCYHFFQTISLKTIPNKFQNKPFLRYDEVYQVEDKDIFEEEDNYNNDNYEDDKELTEINKEYEIIER